MVKKMQLWEREDFKLSTKPQFHGSDLEQIEAYYGIPADQIISFSANVNPLGLSPKFRQSMLDHVDAVISYPDREYKDLRAAISAYCGAPFDDILAGCGATDLISRFIRTGMPRKVMLIDPTYSEYAREISLEGGELISYPLDEKKEFRLDVPELCSSLDDSYDLLIMCNPNNPTGFALRHEGLRELFRCCDKHNINVLVDETYVEFADDMDEITSVPLTREFQNVIVLRGVSKFFAAPGLRLGYAVTSNKKIRDRMNSTKNPWAINSIAALSGAEMFRDTGYIEKTKTFISKERARLVEILRGEANLHVYDPSANFILMRILKENVTSEEVFEHAVKDGLVLRDCSSFPGLGSSHIRFCFCLPQQNDLLIRKIFEMVS